MRTPSFAIRPATATEWDSLIEADSQAVFSQTRFWYEIWSHYSPIRPQAWILELRDAPPLLIPCAWSPSIRGMQKLWTSSVNGIGGPVGSFHLELEQEEQMLQALTRACGRNLTITLNPYHQHWQAKDLVQTAHVHAIDLRLGFEKVVQGFSSHHLRHSKAARKKGVEIFSARHAEDWDAYYGLYEDSLLRWGEMAAGSYPLSLFQAFYASKHPGIKLWLARVQGQIISGALCFYQHRHVCYWHGSGLKAFFKTGAGHLLHHEILQNAFQQGYHWYDMNQSRGIENVIRFKEGFGAQKISLSEFQTLSWSRRSMDWLRCRAGLAPNHFIQGE
jgi:hypothetical protein